MVSSERERLEQRIKVYLIALEMCKNKDNGRYLFYFNRLKQTREELEQWDTG